MTKGGDIAGPKILEHVVDVVLYMEVCSLITLIWKKNSLHIAIFDPEN